MSPGIFDPGSPFDRTGPRLWWAVEENGRCWRTRTGKVSSRKQTWLNRLFVAGLASGVCAGLVCAWLSYVFDITGGPLDWGGVIFGILLTYASGRELLDFVKAGRS